MVRGEDGETIGYTSENRIGENKDMKESVAQGRSEDNDGRTDDRVGERTEAEATRREWKEGKPSTEKREGKTEWNNPVETENRFQCPNTETKFPLERNITTVHVFITTYPA
ncbi:hypothetical protein Pmani_037640 [Petrolisthes manimaculis]|uniref:Uncharacterized protein n=1 Tax=Petrolisthes manimaculis TaxID=1843537 RepID=A0AAE1TN31_9EUCA|nr:hypothetical protein Pmani_037640 [Petrolisthes manimaculis]